METAPSFKTFLSVLMAILISLALIGTAGAANLAQDEPPQASSPQIEVISPYYSVVHLTTPDGTQLSGSIITGPPHPLPEYEAEREASMTAIEPQGTLANFPSYSWVFGCSAVSGAMIAAWYDRGSYPNLYAGPTNGGVMPLTDTSWATWSDGTDTYPNNPLIASHNGVDGRAIKGSIDDYWIRYGNTANDPYITGSWTQHAWSDAIGDYMKTSQSAYDNTDGSTTFYTYTSNPDKLTCATMVDGGISTLDGTYGRKLFYEARGYTVTECYNQKTDNNSGGFTLANFQAEINAGHPVLLNLAGHSIVGYGYNGSTIYIRDTWDNDPAHTYTMPWGGSYEGMTLLSVSIVHLQPNQITTSKVYLPLIMKPIPLPPPPTGVSASDGTFTDKVQVSWSASAGATHYQVFRNTSNNSSSATLLSSSFPSSPYNDTSAVAGTTYFYWIKACNAGGCSSFSASDSGYRQGTTPPTNPFLNPGFELGAANWTQSSTGGWDLIWNYQSTPVTAHDGSWLAWLGGANNETAILSQTITISASAPYLHFWYLVGSEDACGFDFFRVGVNYTNFYQLELCSANNTSGWVQGVLNLSAYVGTNKTVQFTVTTDSSLNSNLFLDDVSMSNSATMSAPEPVSAERYPGAALMRK
jgi:hypothetical protein